jgi:TRAP-type C4-dicarboxylate transport system permease small subunit
MRLFKFDILSITTVISLLFCSFAINKFIDVYTNESSTDKITAWIMLITGVLVSVSLVIQLRNKRKEDSKK